MENLPRQKLIEIIQEADHLKATKGIDVLNEPNHCKQELISRCSEKYIPEVNLLIHAQRAGIVDSLQSQSTDSPLKNTIKRFAQKLIQENSLDQMQAKWVTQSWAMAVISPEAVNLAISSPETELTTILGDVEGQLAIGSDKVIQIGSINGGIVHIYPKKDLPTPQPCTRPVQVRPRRKVDLLDRTKQIKKIREIAKSRIPIELYGKFGFGKTALLQYLAFNPPGVDHRDGLVYLSSSDLTLSDILLKLYDIFFRRPNDFRPNETCIQRDLNGLRALILIDDLKLNRDEMQTLLNTLPESTLILATEEQSLWDLGESLPILGLPKQAALELLKREIGYNIPPEQEETAQRLVALTEGHPLSIKRAAIQIGKDNLSLVRITRMIQESINYDQLLLVQATSSLFEAEQQVLAFLAVGRGAPLPEKHLIALTRLPVYIFVNVIRKLQKHNLVRVHSSSYSPTLDLAELLKQTWDLEPWALRSLRYYTDWAVRKQESTKSLLESMAFIMALLKWGVQLRRWEDVLHLSRAIESTLALSAQWGRWKQVLGWTLYAARYRGDRETVAWTQNQLGVLALSLGDEKQASKNLIRALQSRQVLNDKDGATVTQHNLNLSIKAIEEKRHIDSKFKFSTTTKRSSEKPRTPIYESKEANDEKKQTKKTVFESTWRMDILTQCSDELLAAWKKEGETPGNVTVSPDIVLGLRPYDVTSDNFSTWVRYLENVERVYYVDLSNTKIENENLIHLSHFSHLEEINLSGTEITSSGLANLRRAAGILRLDLSHCKWLDDDGLEYLQILQNLIWLDLSGTNIAHAGLFHLNELTRLTHLILRETKISDTDLNAVEGLRRLEYLDISKTHIDDAGLLPICRFPKLKILWIEDCEKITDAGIAHLSCMEDLQKLRLNGTNITDKGLKHLKHLRHLKLLEVKRCWQITREGIRDLKREDLVILGNPPSH